ncbi:rhodanese-like domain-containing protein [Streptomyces shenzhenensis]|uniref:rhodanese-like domain-containing protein n=1 Tax=Streptomyces shenzhenensis TaxID=943815 RepID=UPI00381F7BF7
MEDAVAETAPTDSKAQLYDVRLAGADVAQLFALPRKAAETRQAAVPAARDACLGDDGATGVTRAELHARVAAGDVVPLDVRPAEEDPAGHVPGAVSLPVEELADHGRHAIRLNDGMLERRLAALPVDAAELT